MSEERLSGELAAIEAALCSLTPTPSAIQRDRLMFLAGKASAHRASSHNVLLTLHARFWRRLGLTRSVRSTTVIDPPLRAAWLWPIATAASLVAAATFGILWAAGNKPQLVVNQAASVSVADLPMTDDLPADTSPPSPWENRRLCQLVLEKGIDAMPESTGRPVSGVPPARHDETNRSLLKQFLDNPTG